MIRKTSKKVTNGLVLLHCWAEDLLYFEQTLDGGSCIIP